MSYTTDSDAYDQNVSPYLRRRLRTYEEIRQHNGRQIVTVHVYPPIPTRIFDWRAYFDGDEETGNYGYGKTECEAIADLKANNE